MLDNRFQKILCLFLFTAVMCMAAWGQEIVGVDSYPIVDDSEISIEDTTVYRNANPDDFRRLLKKNEKYWLRAAMHMKLDMKDNEVNYPKFIKFCVDTYNWADTTFNSYDSAYVVGTGRRWKVFLKSDNWLDSYAMRINGDTPVRMMSDVSSSFGGYLAYMAVSVGYMFEVGHLLFGKPITHSKFEFSFTCALLSASIYYNKNTGGINLHRLGDYNDGRWFSYEFPGLTFNSYGLDAYYFFNNNRYSHGAAYSFSKIQKRSAGSLIAGITVSLQDVDMDFSCLPDDMKAYLPEPDNMKYRFCYYDYCLLAGYGYNWVFAKNWLFNISAMPSFGFKHCLDTSVEGNTDLFSLNIKGMFALVYNHRDFFVGLQGKMDGHWYSSSKYSFFNSIENVSLTAGFRF